MHGPLHSVALCAAALWASGCGGSAATSAPDTTSTTIWPSNATVMVIQSDGGGYTPEPPSGSACLSGELRYTLTPATSTFAWEECRITPDSGPYTRVTGQRVLSQAEVESLLQAVRRVAPSTKTSCGADAPGLVLAVTTPEGEHRYLDDFYACQQRGTYVTGLGELSYAAFKLVQ